MEQKNQEPQANQELKPTYISYHTDFDAVIGSHYSHRKLVETNAHEGPVYSQAKNELFFTTLPEEVKVPIGVLPFEDVTLKDYKKVSIKKVCLGQDNKVEVVQEFSNMANGMTMDLDHNLLICEQGTKTTKAAISKLIIGEHTSTVLVDNWSGHPFNSPNDVVVKRDDGSIWFTDPAYGFAQGFKNAPLVGNFVYRYDPATKSIDVVADSFIRPNGLTFSPDQKKLYINDSAAILGDGSPYNVNMPHHIKVFDIVDDRLSNERLFAVVTPGIPDGLKTDTEGRVYSSSFSGVKVYSPKGKLLGEIFAKGVANFCFGGPLNNTLYICADTVIFEVQLAAVGAGNYN